ncbi:MAG: hypothetical protein IT327_02860 [Anaerolineae bacterium]|nr:hypothetical protein [Anaerolineae bacterium]
MKAYNLFIEKDESPDGDCPYVLIGSHDPADGMDGAVAHVFGDDEAAAEKLAREILDGLSVAGGGESGVLEVNEYQLMGGGPADVVDVRILRRRGKGDQTKWAVVSVDVILNKKGEWETRGVLDFAYSDFMTWDKYQHCYFDTVEDALRCWQTAVVRSVHDKPVQKQTIQLDDLGFFREIQERLTAGVERRDPTQIEYAREMIADWIDELEAEKRPSSDGE